MKSAVRPTHRAIGVLGEQQQGVVLWDYHSLKDSAYRPGRYSTRSLDGRIGWGPHGSVIEVRGEEVERVGAKPGDKVELVHFGQNHEHNDNWQIRKILRSRK